MPEVKSYDHIKFSPDILARLGEELIPNPEQGIIELVKNSYDAFAQQCMVEVQTVGDTVIDIVVSDDGKGMSEDEIKNGWLLLGHSKKSEERALLGEFNRLAVGDKGLGRLSSLRQGESVSLRTRPKSEPGIEYQVDITWADYANAATVEGVKIPIMTSQTNKEHGTNIHIKNIRLGPNKWNMERLARDLILLSSPFDNKSGFRVTLIAPEYAELEKLVKQGYFGEADYHLVATVNNGIAEAKILDFKGDVQYSASHSDIVSTRKTKKETDQKYASPDAQLELWSFLLGNRVYSSTKKTPVSEFRRWLNQVGGVHVYHRGVRVQPYGDPGNDWLEMNLRRSQSPEERPSTNNSLGLLTVDDPEEALRLKTDRIGFVQSDAFSDLRKFCIECLNWMAKVRLKDAEVRRKAQKSQRSKRVTEATEKLQDVVTKKVPAKNRTVVKKAVEEYRKAVDKEVITLKKDLQLYRTLATAGGIIAKFAHQTGQPISTTIRLAKRFEKYGKEFYGKDYEATDYKSSVELLRRAAEFIQSYSLVPLELLKHEKRDVGVIFIHDVIKDSVALVRPFTDRAQINVEIDLCDQDLSFNGTKALLEAILTNFITNSITALTEGDDVRTRDRKILIQTEYIDNNILLKVSDNGPGITLEIDEIWLPGRTTTENGTGFGLTIVKDCVQDLGGRVSAIPNGNLGGAEFTVEIPGTINQQTRFLNQKAELLW